MALSPPPAPPPNIPAIARTLRDIGLALELAGENPFRAAAYAKGAAALEAFAGDLDAAIAAGRLGDIPGIGKGLVAQITELRATGASTVLGELTAKLPPGAVMLSRRTGLPMKAIRTLSEAGVQTEAALAAAAEAGELGKLAGITAKAEAKALARLAENDTEKGELLLVDALDLAEATCAFLSTNARVVAALPVGDVRRALELVDVVEVLAAADDPKVVLDQLASFPRVDEVVHRTDALAEARLHGGARVRVHAVTPGSLAVATQRLTGSRAYNEAVDSVARDAGLRLEDLKVASEEALYTRLGLAYASPLARDDGGPLPRLGTPAARLVGEADVRGVVHCHTVYSDGRATIEEMAKAALAQGMTYITITDHSPTASYAHGVETDRLKKQWDEIARVEETLKVKILRGTETDILKDGAFDYPDDVLERLDVIVASIHQRYRLDPKAMTARIVRALRHPLFKIWGHALGRLLQKRPPVEVDMEAILEAAAESRVAIEINGDPHRLDLEPRWAKRAKALGVPFVISVDAHATAHLGHLRFGVLMAGRAGLGPEDVLNTRSADAFMEAVRPLPAASRATS